MRERVTQDEAEEKQQQEEEEQEKSGRGGMVIFWIETGVDVEGQRHLAQRCWTPPPAT